MSEKAEVWNLTEASEKHRLMRQISRLPPGLYTVLIRAKRPVRSLDANAYYFVAVVTPFREWLIENWGERVTQDQAHETLKLALMEMPEPVNGIQLVPSTRALDSAAFSEYVESAIQFLATKCDIAVIPSDLYFEGAR